jgi:peptide/nickel transport system substrate-binding protein
MKAKRINDGLRRGVLVLAIICVWAGTVWAAKEDLVVGVQNMSMYIDPGKDHSNVGSQQYVNTFEPLIGWVPASTTARYEPTGLASGWKLITPQLMELKLRKGVTFHNGDPLTAEDVVFTLQRMFNPSFPPYVVRRNDFLENMYRAEVVDAETVRVWAKKPEPLFETLLSIQQTMIVPKKYIMGLTGHPEVDENSDYEAFGLKPVGTGPYKVKEFIPGERLVWERFEGYRGPKAPFRTVTLKKINELSARITALRNGEVDLITNIPPDQIAAIQGDPKLKAEGMVTPLFHVVIFNTQHPKMADKRLRQGLAMAIDRDTLNKALWLGKAVVPPSHTYPQYGPLYMPEIQTFQYDTAKAKELIKASGYDGFPIRYDSSAVYYTNGLLAAQAIQEMWGKVGVNMNINVVEHWTGPDSTMMSRNWSNPMYFADPVGSFGTMWHPTAAAVHEGRFKPGKEYAEIWNRFRYSMDLGERKKAWGELMDYIKEEIPFLILYQPYESYGMIHSLNWKPLPGHIPYVLDFRAGSVSLTGK